MTQTVEQLCRLPIDFHEVGTKSLLQLIDESGYWDAPDTVTESALANGLAAHPNWCDAWIGYSQDRRTGSGWFIEQHDDEYLVQYYPNGSNVLRFTSKHAACAAFAIRELHSLVDRGT